MARLESKSITIVPESEQSTIRQYEMFGWTLQSSQEIYSKDSHLEKDYSDTLWSVTTTTNYVKLVFQRDKDMPMYDEVLRLEQEYQANLTTSQQPYTYPSKLPGKLLMVVLGFLAVVGVGTLITAFINIGSGQYDAGELIVGIIMGILILGVAVGIYFARHFLYYVPKYKQACAAGQKCDVAEDKCREIEKKIRAMGLNA